MSGSKAPINSKWKAAMPAFERAFGRVRAAHFLGRLIPLRYDGDKLILGAPSPWHRHWVIKHYCGRVEKILGAPVQIEVSEIARVAEARQRAEAHQHG